MSGYLAKLILVGDSRVGKSSILIQFSEGRIQESYTKTIGVEFASRIIEVDDISWNLQVWDNAGSPAFQSIIRSYYRGAAGGFIVYSVASRESFDHVTQFLQDIRSQSPNASLILVGNKVDCDRQVSTEEGQRLANTLGLPFVELTARSRGQVDLPFFLICRILSGKISSGEVDISDTSGIRRF